jgi:hypothetical protein
MVKLHRLKQSKLISLSSSKIFYNFEGSKEKYLCSLFLTLKYTIMAVAKLGMIITDIAGSIGGTTLKRQSGNIAIYNKSRGANKSILYQNKALGYMSSTRQYWRNLLQNEKSSWDNAASRFTFPDKFGTQRNVTGYQLFTKSTNALAIVSETACLADDYDQVINNFTIEDFIINKDDESCVLSVTNSGNEQYYLISFDVNCKSNSKPIFNKRKIYYNGFEADEFELMIDSAFWDSFPWVQIGQNVRLYVTPMNVAGYKGVTQYIDTTVI